MKKEKTGDQNLDGQDDAKGIEQLTEILRSTEINFRNLFNSMSEGVALHEIVFDGSHNPVDYRYLSINPAFTSHTGLGPDFVLGKTATEVFHTSVPPFLDIYAKAASSDQPSAFETHFAPLDKHFRISVSSPKEGQFVTVFEDITERKRADEMLRVSLAKYQVLFDAFPVGITISDSEGKIIESNPLAEKLLGISRDEQERRTIGGEEWRIIRPDGSPMPSEEFASVRALKEERRIDNVEMGIVKGGEKVTWINVSAAPLPLKGYGVAITYHDTTARKQLDDLLRETNAYLENLINYANAPIIVWDTNFRITRFNKAFEHLTGLSEKKVTGQSIEILFPASMIRESMALIRKTLTGERWESVEIIIQHSDGSLKTVLWNSATIFKANGITPIATIAQGHNITLRKQTEKMLQAKNDELEKTISEKDKFFSIIAHDLRNPFNAFLGFTQLMSEELDRLDPEEIRKIAESMRRSATNLYALLENLLEWSRMQRGLTTYSPANIFLMPILEDSLAMVTDMAHQKEISIKYAISTGTEIYTDENMFKTLIRNLVSNAVKFTPKGGEIVIQTFRRNDHSMEIAVKDTGIGIPQEMMKDLFSLEKNTCRKGTNNEPSTGLGLILCKDFVEKHGGEIWAESTEGQGSVFRFTLPGKRN
jgi:PAS domain S-box-containing protein